MTASPYEPAPVATDPATPRHGAGMATTALVLGILALVTCFTVIGGIVLGLLAVVFGFIARGRARRGAPGGGRAVAGIVTGVIGLLVAVALIAFGVSILNSPAGKNLTNCVKNANGDQSAISQCEQQYNDSH
jgi:heme/copper-type cytochrome/quinol oxidase subunit 2